MIIPVTTAYQSMYKTQNHTERRLKLGTKRNITTLPHYHERTEDNNSKEAEKLHRRREYKGGKEVGKEVKGKQKQKNGKEKKVHGYA